MSQEKIDISEHPWRFTCPNNHRSFCWTNSHWWCQACSQHPDLDPEFHEIIDQKTGESLSREEVTFSRDKNGGLTAD